VSLLVHEGRNIIEVARQVGHSPVICQRDYGQVFDDSDPADRQPAADIIAAARAAAERAVFPLGSHAPDSSDTQEKRDAR
jgi:hypothetical protein